jgi:hypothetical protein
MKSSVIGAQWWTRTRRTKNQHENDWNYAARKEREHFKIHRMGNQYLNFVNYWKIFTEKQKHMS